MKFSVNWLREFVDLPKNPEDIAELLTRAGIETKNIQTRGANVDNVVVSQIKASSRHPNADRLSVCEVDDGSGTKRQIVCGATNYKVGDKVPLALPGAKLPNGRWPLPNPLPVRAAVVDAAAVPRPTANATPAMATATAMPRTTLSHRPEPRRFTVGTTGMAAGATACPGATWG